MVRSSVRICYIFSFEAHMYRNKLAMKNEIPSLCKARVNFTFAVRGRVKRFQPVAAKTSISKSICAARDSQTCTLDRYTSAGAYWRCPNGD